MTHEESDESNESEDMDNPGDAESYEIISEEEAFEKLASDRPGLTFVQRC